MRPEITLGNAEHRRLLILAMAGPGHTADDSDFLHHELDRACVIPDHRLPDDTVRVGSMVTYRPDGRGARTVTLAYPDQVDPRAGRISVTSPVGAALIGLRAGQAITRMGWDGAFTTYTVLSVVPPRGEQ